MPAGTTAYSATQSWRDTIADSGGAVTQGLVAITLQRTVAGGFGITLSPSPAYGDAVTTGTPVTATATVTATPTGATGTVAYTWARVDPNGGTDFFLSSATSATTTFRMSSNSAISRTQTWRCTATDDTGTVVKDVEVTLEVAE